MADSVTQGSSSTSLAYGAWHSRYKMCVPNCGSPTTTTYYLYDPETGGTSEKIVSGASTTWVDYVRTPHAGLLAIRFQTGSAVTWRYIVKDHLGSVTSVLDNSGTPTVESDSYDPWGKRRNANGSDAACGAITSQTTRGYTGHEMLDSFCLINMNARIQDPSLGRFLTPDTVVADPYDTQAFNRTCYVENNPMNRTDPAGHIEECTTEGGHTVCEIIGKIDSNPVFNSGNGLAGIGDGGLSGGDGGDGGPNPKPPCSVSKAAVKAAQAGMATGNGLMLTGAALDASTIPTEVLGGGPEDPLADTAAYWEMSTGTGMVNSGLATAGASSGFLLANGLPREATNFAFDYALDLYDKEMVPDPAAQQLLDDQLDAVLNGIEDALGLAQDTCQVH